MKHILLTLAAVMVAALPSCEALKAAGPSIANTIAEQTLDIAARQASGEKVDTKLEASKLGIKVALLVGQSAITEAGKKRVMATVYAQATEIIEATPLPARQESVALSVAGAALLQTGAVLETPIIVP